MWAAFTCIYIYIYIYIYIHTHNTRHATAVHTFTYILTNIYHMQLYSEPCILYYHIKIYSWIKSNQHHTTINHNVSTTMIIYALPFTIIIIIMIIHFTRPHKYYKHPVVTNCTITYSTVTHTGVAQYCSHPYRRSTILQPPIPVQHNSTVTHTGAAQFCSHPYRCSTILQSPIPV